MVIVLLSIRVKIKNKNALYADQVLLNKIGHSSLICRMLDINNCVCSYFAQNIKKKSFAFMNIVRIAKLHFKFLFQLFLHPIKTFPLINCYIRHERKILN